MDRKKLPLGRQSILAQSNQKTPTRQRFSMAQTPDTARKDARFSLGTTTGVRRMSLFKQPAAPARVDTSDKRVQMDMAKKIADFINDLEGEDSHIHPNQLLKPTAKEFISFLELIYECVCPNYELGEKKMADEVPRLFSSLGYPHPIKPSFLQPVGASHNWHYLLHALCWLVDFVIMTRQIEAVVGQSILLSGDDNTGNISALRYSWLHTKFKEYSNDKTILHQPDVAEREKQNLRLWFNAQEDVCGQLECVKSSLEQLRKENAELEHEKGSEDKLKDDIRGIEDDIRKAVNYKEALEQAVANIEIEKKQAEDEASVVKKELDELRDALQQKKNLAAEQERGINGIKGEEARQIMTEHDRNGVLLRQLQNELEVLGRERWHLQPKDSQALAHLLSRFSELRSAIKMIRLNIFPEEEFVEPTPKDIRELQSMLYTDLRALVSKTRCDFERRINDVNKTIQSLHQKKSSIDIRTQVEIEKLTDLNRIYSRKRLHYDRDVNDHQQERKSLQQRIDHLENERETLESDYRDVGKLEQDLDIAQREFYEIQEKIRFEKVSLEGDVIQLLLGPMGVCEKIKSKIEDNEKVFSSIINEYYSTMRRLNMNC